MGKQGKDKFKLNLRTNLLISAALPWDTVSSLSLEALKHELGDNMARILEWN